MHIQVIQDSYGNNTGVYIPLNDWNKIVEKYQDLKNIADIDKLPQKKLSDLAGSLSKETAELLQKSIDKNRIEWDDRLNKQI